MRNFQPSPYSGQDNYGWSLLDVAQAPLKFVGYDVDSGVATSEGDLPTAASAAFVPSPASTAPPYRPPITEPVPPQPPPTSSGLPPWLPVAGILIGSVALAGGLWWWMGRD